MLLKMLCIISFFLIFFTGNLNAAQHPHGNPNAPQGGRITINIGAEPPTLNPVTSQDLSASEVQGYILDSLYTRNPDTYEWEPYLAKKIETSKDGLQFSVHLREGLQFSDGKPLTAEDVKFSFEVIFDETYNAAPKRPYFEGIAKVEVIDPLTVKFYAKERYFGNFETIASFAIIPKHIYGDAKEGVKLNKTIIGSGPYILDEYEKGKRIILKRNPKWWGLHEPFLKGEYNFAEIQLRFIKEEQVTLEMLKAGTLDTLALTPEGYIKKTEGPEWAKSINKYKVTNKKPQGYYFVAWNFNESMFQDKRVRKALYHLMNRKLMIEKFLYNMSLPATGPWYQDSIYASPRVKPVEYSPKKASELLAAAGWKDSDKDGILDKAIDGKKVSLKFTLLNPSKDVEKYLTLYKEDLKKAGVDMEIQYMEWNSFMKLLDEKKFQAVTLGWGNGSVDLDPKQIWHSASAVPGGSNFISYKNPEVDNLIDKARTQLKRSDRIKTLQKVYELIADDAPYAFMFNRKYIFYANQKRIKTPKDTYNYTIGDTYWWLTDKE